MDTSNVAQAIASTCHALTIEALRKHNRRQKSTTHHSNRNSHAKQVSSSLQYLDIDHPSHLHAQTIQSIAGTTPMERFEGQASFPYQQHSTYQPHIISLLNDTSKQIHEQLSSGDDFSVRAELGANDCHHAQGGIADVMCWAPEEHHYVYAMRSNKDMTEWGQCLAGVGAQFGDHPGNLRHCT